MALANIGFLEWPFALGAGAALTTFWGTISLVYDSATDRIAYVGDSPYADTLDTIYFRMGNVTTGCTLDVRVETVVNGRPSGILWAVNTNASVVVNNTDSNLWKTANLTAGVSLTRSSSFAIVFVVSAGIPNMNFVKPNLVGFGGYVGVYPLLLQDTGAGAWANAGGPNMLEAFCKFTTAGVKPLYGLLPIDGNVNITEFNANSSPNEILLSFVAPAKIRVIGMKAMMGNIAAGANFTFSLWPASSTTDADALAQKSLAGNNTYSTTNEGTMTGFFNNTVTLAAGTTYKAGVRADTVNNLYVARMPTPSGIANSMQAFPIPANANESVRAWTAGSAGAITDNQNMLPMISLILDQADDGIGAGAGGGLLTHPGMAGGARG